MTESSEQVVEAAKPKPEVRVLCRMTYATVSTVYTVDLVQTISIRHPGSPVCYRSTISALRERDTSSEVNCDFAALCYLCSLTMRTQICNCQRSLGSRVRSYATKR